MADLVNNLNLDVLKVPLGFIRVVEFPLVIIAFASACNLQWTGKVNINSASPYCPKSPPVNQTGTIHLGYPFALPGSTLNVEGCTKELKTPFSQSYKSQAEFFVFTGVVSFLFIIGMTALYLLKWPLYENDRRIPLVDLGVTTVLAVFWVCGTVAWSVAVTSIRGHTEENVNKALDGICGAGNCKLEESTPSYGGIIISAIAGYGVIVAFIGNVWFVYKETDLFKNRQGPPPVGNIPGSTDPGDYPPAAASGAGPYP